MILVTARNTALPGMRDKFIEAAKGPTEATRKEKGCLFYTLYAAAENDTDLLYFEAWETAEDLAAHLASKHMQDFFRVQKEQGLLDVDKKVISKYEIA